MRLAEVPRAMPEVRAVSGLSDCVARRPENRWTDTIPGGALAYRPTQDRSTRLLGRRTHGRRDKHAFREAAVLSCGCGRHHELPPGLRDRSLSWASGSSRRTLRV